MMATTHALAGVMLAAFALFFAPEHAPIAVAAGFAGGLFPDFDLYFGHRKTLHFPVYYSLAVPIALGGVLLSPGTWTVAVAFFLAAAAFHSVMDVFGGGLELKPWLGQSDRAVYDHFRGRWLSPRRWIRYDGAPEDLAVAVLFGVIALPMAEGSMQLVIGGAIVVSAVYALLRKRMVAAAHWLVSRLPRDVLAYVPDRFTADLM